MPSCPVLTVVTVLAGPYALITLVGDLDADTAPDRSAPWTSA